MVALLANPARQHPAPGGVLLLPEPFPKRTFVGRRKNPNLPPLVERPRPGQCPLTGGVSHLEAGPGPAVIVR